MVPLDTRTIDKQETGDTERDEVLVLQKHLGWSVFHGEPFCHVTLLTMSTI